MARVGKIVTFTGSRETISNVIVQGIQDLSLTSGINFGFVNDTTMNIYGEQTELQSLKTYAEGLEGNFTFTIGGNAPAEPVSTPDTPPTADEITAEAELKTAFNTVMQAKRDAFWTDIETEYNIIKTTAEPFRRYTDLKHLRQKG